MEWRNTAAPPVSSQGID